IVVIGTTGGYLLAKQALRPIAKLTATARQLSTENLDQRINLGGPDDELRRMGAVLEQATERAQRLVASLLTLARLQAVERGELEVREPVDLATLVPDVLDGVAAEANAKGVKIETEIEAAAAMGDPRLLERLIGNLVEKAIRHNVPDGWLRVTTGQTAERVWLHVSNGGAVIAASDVDTLFEPF